MTATAIAPDLSTVPAWVVCSWPPVLWQDHDARECKFVHLGTRVLSAPFDDGLPRAGQTVWGSDRGGAGLAWDWIEMSPGVVALADPMGLVSNLQFIDHVGNVLDLIQTAMLLNGIVHELPWQREVQRALQAAPH